MKARGIRNDNPLNIRRTKDRWTGMRERQTDKTFVQFAARVYGYRAAFVPLRGDIGRGADTIGRIIVRWAPSRDGNDTQAYIRHVSRSTGIGAGQALSFEDKDALVEIVRSMAHMESGIIEDKAIIEQAYEMARK